MNDPNPPPPEPTPLSDASEPRVIPDGASDPDRTTDHVADGSSSHTTTVVHAPADEDAPAGATSAAPDYVLVNEVGKGGMGVVYRARQTKLNRDVALKQMKLSGGERERGTAKARFLAEASAIAAIKHENVVQVFDYGEMDGQPFMALEFCAGGTLVKLLPKGPAAATAPRELAAVVAQVARGVAAAHALGIVHRDLKPGNVLLDEKGVPKVADFGLAKRVATPDATTDAGVGARGTNPELTVAGTVSGTPAYMAPEQARGDPFVGPQADVWALGVILYEALTGEKPFYDKDPQVTLKRVRTAAPMPPRAAVRSVPLDLELICLKCLSKDQHERYPDAKELADDIERFLRGEPTRARPAGLVERAVKWAKRNPVVSAATAAVAVALVAGAAVSIYFGLDARREANRANGETEKAKSSEADARGKGTELTRVNGKLEQSNRENVRQLVRLRIAAADVRINAGDPVAALPELVDGLATLEGAKVADADLERALRIKFAAITALAPKPVRVWTEPEAVVHAELSADGTRVLTLNRDGTARVTSATTGEQVRHLRAPTAITRAALSPDGARVVTGERNGRVVVWDAVTGNHVGPPVALGQPVLHVAFSADGRRFLAAGGELYQSSRLVKIGKATIAEVPEAVVTVWAAPAEPSGQSKRIAKFVESWWISHAAFAPSGKEIAFASGSNNADESLVSFGTLDAKPKVLLRTFEHETDVLRVAYSHDGARVVAACGGIDVTRAVAVIRDAKTGKIVGQPLVHANSVTRASFNNTGSLVLTGSDDRTARIWDAQTTQPVSPPLGHRDRITAAEFAPDGKLVLTASRDGTVRLWHGTLFNDWAGDPAAPPLPHGSPVLSASWSRDGKRVLTACENGVVRLWDVGSALARAPAYAHAGKVTYARVLSDTALLTATGENQTLIFAGGGMGVAHVHLQNKKLHIWDRKQPTNPRFSTDHTGPAEPWLVAPNNDRAGVVTGGSPFNPARKFAFWSLTTGASRAGGVNPDTLWAGFAADGRHLAVVPSIEGPKDRVQHVVTVIDGDTGAPVVAGLKHAAPVHRAAVSADGLTLLTVSGVGTPHAPAAGPNESWTARVWDITSGTVRREYQIPKPSIDSLFLSPSGATLAVATAAEVLLYRPGSDDKPVVVPDRDVLHVAYSADEKFVVTASAARTARVWNVATGLPQGAPLEHREQVRFATFSPCGRFVATAGEDGAARVWDARTGQPLSPWLAHRGPVTYASFAPDGVRVATASADGTARVWELLAADDRPLKELALVAEVLAGQRPDPTRAGAPSTPTSYLEAWRQLSAARPTEYAGR